jgi:hypothetical protein
MNSAAFQWILRGYQKYMRMIAHRERRNMMSDKKSKAKDTGKKTKPSVSNDQLGENAAEGRFEKTVGTKSKKCR